MTVNAVLQNICNIAISQLRRMLSCKRKKKHKKGINTSLCDPFRLSKKSISASTFEIATPLRGSQ